MSVKDEIKAKIVSKGWTITDVANELEKKYNKKYSSQNLSNKLSRETIQYKEVKDIANIIGLKIKWTDK
ncbi:LLM class flavin-dependent oxidoreductase [Orenia marismortui]|uniref:LLM class flavin-dependent oxidoreductase n=1 Tax=Orenia marismortui TaxID=46469 RepID=A0A4V3GWE5_9FIRM|nr:LLM class flavin-dependent oxidoreductase [Orenia marismortui]TDX43699.1 hypothetical protein C7959_1592 [Orenia marismortui]